LVRFELFQEQEVPRIGPSDDLLETFVFILFSILVSDHFRQFSSLTTIVFPVPLALWNGLCKYLPPVLT